MCLSDFIARRGWVAAVVAATALLAAPSPGAAASDRGPLPETVTGPDEATCQRIRQAIGERWGIEAERVRLEWGVTPRGREMPDGPSFRLVGSGSGGAWVVLFEDEGGDEFGLRVRAGVEAEVPVAARRLERGAVLEPADIAFAPKVTWGPAGVTSEDGPQPGWVVQRTVTEGERLRAPAVAPPPAVRSGDQVRVLWKSGSLELAMQGVAVGTASEGEPVTVRLLTGRRFRGVARGHGVVSVQGASND